MDEILELAQQLADKIADLPSLHDRAEALNRTRLILHEVSPFKAEPVDCVLWVRNEHIIANEYNPNSVARPEMKLLEHSIDKNGFAMPVITAALPAIAPTTLQPQKVVDGFHRHKVGKESARIRERLHGYLPIANIAGDATDLAHLMSATVEFNRARGEHSVELMAALVKAMIEIGQTDQQIARHLGMEAEEVLRLKQVTGLASLFKNQSYSMAWETIDEPSNQSVD